MDKKAVLARQRRLSKRKELLGARGVVRQNFEAAKAKTPKQKTIATIKRVGEYRAAKMQDY